jgi:TonB family protein
MFTITAEGRVRDAKVTVSAPEGWYFEEAALKAVREWRYQPAGADTPGNVVLLKFAIAPPPAPTVYLGAFTINAANLEPIVTKNCDPVAPDDAESALNSTVADFESRFGMSCGEQADNQGYQCVDRARTTIARIRVLNALARCREYPSKFASEATTLMNRR